MKAFRFAGGGTPAAARRACDLRGVVAAGVAAALALHAAVAAADGVRGVVVDADGAPLPGALVELCDALQVRASATTFTRLLTWSVIWSITCAVIW